MTKIRMDWDLLTLTAEGHAGGGTKGNDPICAGISALTMALLNQLKQDDQTDVNYKVNEKDGMIYIHAKPKNCFVWSRIMDYFRVIVTGIEAWEKAYPENITLEEVNKDGTD